MAKFRKKPVVIEAEIYQSGLEDGEAMDDHGEVKPFIDTLEGKLFINPGDYIITGVAGERYPCKPEIFNKTYDQVEE